MSIKTNGWRIIVRWFDQMRKRKNKQLFTFLVVAFYNHVNALYNAMHGFCTAQNCPVMTGPQNRFANWISVRFICFAFFFFSSSYLWIDEKNKKLKCSAPQYVDNTLMYIQRTLSDETIFPTRLGKSDFFVLPFASFVVYRSTISSMFRFTCT